MSYERQHVNNPLNDESSETVEFDGDAMQLEDDDYFVHNLFYPDGKSNLSIVEFTSVLKMKLGFNLRFDEVQALYATVAGEGGIQWAGEGGNYTIDVGAMISRDMFDRWWVQGLAGTPSAAKAATHDVGLEDIVTSFRSLLRVAAIFDAARESIASMPTQHGPEKTKILFNRIDAANLAKEMRLTLGNLYTLTKDLGLRVSEEQFKLAVNEMDPSNHGEFVNYKAFEEWWRVGSRADKFDEGYENQSGQLRSMLRVGGLLTSHGSTVKSALVGAQGIVEDPELLHAIDLAINSITKNSTGHVGHLLEAAQTNIDSDRANRKTATSGIQQCSQNLTESVAFEVLILTCILVNLIFLGIAGRVRMHVSAVEQGVNLAEATIFDDEQVARDVMDFLEVMGFVFNGIFTVEMVLRITAASFVTGPAAYMKNWWNIFDFVVINSMWIGFIASYALDSTMDVISTLTVLRSLRALRFFRGTREITTTLGMAANTLVLMLILIVSLWLMFSIIGRELFAGALSRSCDAIEPQLFADDTDGSNFDEANISGRRSLAGGGPTDTSWLISHNATVCPTSMGCSSTCYERLPKPGPKERLQHIDKFGFDTMTQSLLTVFSITALDEWMNISGDSISSLSSMRSEMNEFPSACVLSVDPIILSPLKTNVLAWIFFMFGVLILGLLSVNLFLASITFSYLDMKQHQRQKEALDKAHQTLVAILMNPGSSHELLGLGKSQSVDYDSAPGTQNAVQQMCRKIVYHKGAVKLDDFILVVVVLNTIGMATEHHNMSDIQVTLLYSLEIVWTICYVMEAVVKIGADNFKVYWSSNMNRMDFFIVASAIFGYCVEIYAFIRGVDLSGSVGDSTGGDGNTYSSLRIVRMLRVARAMRAVRLGKLVFRAEAIRNTMSQAFSSLYSVFSLIGLIAFVIIIMSVLGRHLFWACHEHCLDNPRSCVYTRGNYGTLFNAVLANYQLFTRDNWANIMYEYMECTGGGWYVQAYFVVLFTSLNFILLPIFVSIFLDNFSLSEEEKRNKQVELYIKSTFRHSKGIINVFDVRYINHAVRLLYKGSRILKRVPVGMVDGVRGVVKGVGGTVNFVEDPRRLALEEAINAAEEAEKAERDVEAQTRGRSVSPSPGSPQRTGETRRISKSPGPRGSLSRTGSRNGSLSRTDSRNDRASPVSSEDKSFQGQLLRVVEHMLFQYFIGLMILGSGIVMALEGPDGKVHTDAMLQFFEVAEYVLYTVFLIECLCKIIAYGFYGTETAYLNSTSNVFDFGIVSVTTVGLLLTVLGIDAKWVQMVRLARTLRLVRLLFFMKGMGVMAQAIVKCFPSVGAILGMLIANIMVFSIIGMNIFMGEMFYCTENGTKKFGESDLNKSRCYAQHGPGSWVATTFNFDNWFEAIKTLSLVSTRQGWYIIFYKFVDAAEMEGQAPAYEQNITTASVFFICFILINGFMLEELFIGMLVEVFSQSSGTVLLTAAQKKLRYIQVFMFHRRVTQKPAPSHPVSLWCYNLIKTQAYQTSVTWLVSVGVVVMVTHEQMYEIRDAPTGLNEFDALNVVVLFLYSMHLGLLLVAYGNVGYFLSQWADYLIIALLWFATILALLQHAGHIDAEFWGVFQTLQSLRVFWVFNILNTFPSMRKIVQTIRLSVPQTMNIATLFLLLTFIFGIVAMKLYGDIDLAHPDNDFHGHGITQTANFGSIVYSMRLLVQISTGHPLPYLVEEMEYAVDSDGNRVGASSVIPFFFVFFILSNFVFLNLFVALLLENFEYIWDGEYAIEEVDIKSFDEGWDQVISASDGGALNAKKLEFFVDRLEGPLKNLIQTDPFWYNRLLVELDIDINDIVVRNDIHVEKEELLLALARMRYGNSCLPFELEVQAELRLKQRHEENALRLMRVYVGAWRLMRNPPSEYKTEAEIRKYKVAVQLARLWAIGVVIRNSRLTRHQSWHAQDVESAIRNRKLCYISN
eukprot:SAG31_NODE_329_length_17643_cov_10.377793_2_plen_1951_part_00